jgi:hypothetical protein
VALFFFLIGGGLLWFTALKPLVGIVRARSWRETTCEIVESWVESTRGGARTAYRWRARYQYELAGRAWTGDRTSFFEGFTRSARRREKEVTMPAGARVPCFVDPEAPHESVLDRGPSWRLLWALLPLALLAFGLATVASPSGPPPAGRGDPDRGARH